MNKTKNLNAVLNNSNQLTVPIGGLDTNAKYALRVYNKDGSVYQYRSTGLSKLHISNNGLSCEMHDCVGKKYSLVQVGLRGRIQLSEGVIEKESTNKPEDKISKSEKKEK